MKKINILSIIAAAMLTFSSTYADDKILEGPIGSDKLADVITHLNSLGYKYITDVEYDDGRWEIEAIFKGEKREITVDPMSMHIIDGAKPVHHDK